MGFPAMFDTLAGHILAGHGGPFIDSNEEVYYIGVDDGLEEIVAWSFDPSSESTVYIRDGGSEPSSWNSGGIGTDEFARLFCVDDIADNQRILCYIHAGTSGSTNGGIFEAIFYTSDHATLADTWHDYGSSDFEDLIWNTSVEWGAEFSIGAVLRSDGDKVVFFSSEKTGTKHGDPQKVAYIKDEGSGWDSSPTDIESTNNAQFYSCVLAESDRILFSWIADNSGDKLYVNELSAAYSTGTLDLAYNGPDRRQGGKKKMCYYDDEGVEKVFLIFRDPSDVDYVTIYSDFSQDTPTEVDNSRGIVSADGHWLCAGVEGAKKVWVFGTYSGGASAMTYRYSNDDEGGWSSATLVYSGVTITFTIDSNIYIRDGYYRLGLASVDGGGEYLGEVQLSQAGSIDYQTVAATAVGSAALTTTSTRYRTLAATALGVAVLATFVQAYRALAATAIGGAAITTVATWYRTLAATAVGVAVLVTALMYERTLAAVAVGVATLETLIGKLLAATAVVVADIPSKLKTFYRTIAATAVGVAVIARELTLYRTMEAVAVGVAAITTVATWYRTLAATAVGVATLLPAILKLVVMDAVAVGVAGLATVRTVVQSLDATAIGTAAITSVSTWYRTLAATAIGVANRSQVVTWYRTLAATAIGVPVIATVATWYRTLAATAVGLAELIALEVAYPEVEGYTDWNEPLNTTAPTLTYPGSIAEDETLIAIVVTDGDNVVSGFPAGWAEIDSSDNGAAAHLSVWEKLALGTESGSFDITLGSSEQACGTIMRISGNSANWPSESPAISAATTGSDTSVEIANCAPGAGSKRFLWLAICGMDDDDLPTAIGDSFTDLLTLDSGSANNSCCGAWARRELEAASYDHPNGFTQPTSEEWISFMVAIFPVVVGTTFYETLAATQIGVATLTGVPTHVQTLAATEIGVAVIATIATFYRNLSATSVGVAGLVKKMYVTLEATAVGVATLLGVLVSLVSLQAVAVGEAVLTAVPTYVKALAATAVCSAIITTLTTWYRTLAASAVGDAVIATVATYYRTLEATAVGVAGIVAVATHLRTLAATAIGVAGMALVTTWYRTLAAIQTGVAAIGTLFIPGEEPPPERDDFARRAARRWLRTFGRWRKGHGK